MLYSCVLNFLAGDFTDDAGVNAARTELFGAQDVDDCRNIVFKALDIEARPAGAAPAEELSGAAQDLRQHRVDKMERIRARGDAFGMLRSRCQFT